MSPVTSKSEVSKNFVDISLIPGRLLKDDSQRLFAAVDLERDGFAVLKLDLALGQGGADQSFDAGVVDFAGQAEARVGPPAAVGELGLFAEEIIVGVGGGVQEAVDGLRLPPAIETLALDPGKLGQGVDQLGLGAALGIFFEVLEGRVDVVAVFLVEIESPQRFQRAVTGLIETGDAALQAGRAVAPTRLNRDGVRPTQERGGQNGPLCQRHGGSLPRPTTEGAHRPPARDRMQNDDDEPALRSIPIDRQEAL